MIPANGWNGHNAHKKPKKEEQINEEMHFLYATPGIYIARQHNKTDKLFMGKTI